MAKLKLLGMFLLGFALGVVIMIVLIMKGPVRVVQTMWVTTIVEHAKHARMIHEGQAAKVEEMLEETFIQSAMGLQKLKIPKERKERALGEIRKYYDATGEPPPLPLQNIFKTLPPVAQPQTEAKPSTNG